MPPREDLNNENDSENMNINVNMSMSMSMNTNVNVNTNVNINEQTALLVPLKKTSERPQLRLSSSSVREPWPVLAKREVTIQSKIFFPALQSMILSKIPWFITLRILGQMDNSNDNNNNDNNNDNNDNTKGVELAAAALATTLCNVTGLSLCVGLSFALRTLAGQAKGELSSRAASSSRAKKRTETTHTTVGGGGGGGGIETAAAAATTTTKPKPKTAGELESQTALLDNNNNNNNNYYSYDFESSTPNTTVVFLLRGLVIQVLVVIPVGIWWLRGIDSFLVGLGQTPELAARASAYLRILVPSLWIYSVSWTVTAWSQSIGMADVPARASLLGVLLHVPFNLLFCFGLGLGYLGCAYATICFQTVQCAYIVARTFGTASGRERVLTQTGGRAAGRTTLTLRNELAIAVGTVSGFAEYLALAIPGIVAISEWWSSEVAIFMGGRLVPDPQVALSAMTIYQSINTFCFVVPMGFSVAGTARVGNLLGAGDVSGAAVAGKVAVINTAMFGAVLGLVLYSLPHAALPGLFVSSEEHEAIIETTAATIPWLSTYVFADAVKTGFNSIIQGCGRQPIMVPIVIVSYWVVGVPLSYYLGLYRNGGDDTLCRQYHLSHNNNNNSGQHLYNYETDENNYHDGGDGGGGGDDDGMYLCGDIGLVAGITVGTWVHMILTAVVVIATTNWKTEAYKARLRVTKKNANANANANEGTVARRQKQRRRQSLQDGGDEYDDECDDNNNSNEYEYGEEEMIRRRKQQQRLRATKSDGNL